jgi:hypothetical protein
MNRGYDSHHGSVFPGDDEDGGLPRKRRKAIRSLQKLVERHQRKIADFKRDQPVRPGMEGMDAEVIASQQQRRIQHLEREVRAFQKAIRRLRDSE